MIGDAWPKGYFRVERIDGPVRPDVTLEGEEFWRALEAAGSGWIRPVLGEFEDTGAQRG